MDVFFDDLLARMTYWRNGRVQKRWFAILIIASLAFASARSLAQDRPSQDQPAQSPEQAQQNHPPDNPAPQIPAQQQIPEAQNPPTDKTDENPSKAAEVAEATKRLGEATLDKVRDWENGWFTGPYISRNRERVPLTADQRRHIYLEQTLTTPSAYFKRMFAASVDQARDAPSQWPEGWNGYSERFASHEGQFIIANSLAALGNAKLKYEPRYDECRCQGFWPRARHAIWRNFVTYDETELRLRPQWALYGGAFAGGAIATSWKPHPRNALANGGIAALEQGGYGAALNFFIEFAGEINRKLGARKK